MHLLESSISEFPGGACPHTQCNWMQLLLSKVVKTLEAHHQTCNSSITDTRGTGVALNSFIFIRIVDRQPCTVALIDTFSFPCGFIAIKADPLIFITFEEVYLYLSPCFCFKETVSFFCYKQATMPLAFTWDVIVGFFFPKPSPQAVGAY